jgi:DNA-binding response OmpR family regulator
MPRLLVVDGDEAIRRLFDLNLGDDYEIIDTDDPEKARALSLEHKPAAILLDVGMPKLSDPELCQLLHRFSQANLIPILAISSDPCERAQQVCVALGVSGLFPKPIDFEALKARLITLHRRAMVPRSELRIRLKVPLKLRGTDGNGIDFETATTTDNVSLNGFYGTVPAQILEGGMVEVYLAHDGKQLAGRARCVRKDAREGEPSFYAFRFVERTGNWILR